MRRDRSILLSAVLVLVPVTGCNRQPATNHQPAAPAGTHVSVVRPEMRQVHRVVEQPGTVEAFEETALFAKLMGYIGSVEEDPEKLVQIAKNTPEKEVWPKHDRFFDRGSRVKKNQVLARLSIPELDEEQKQKDALVKQAYAEQVQAQKAHAAAGAAVASANALVTEANAGVDRAQANYESWQKEFDRIAKLVKGGVGDNQTRDQTENQFRAAEAAHREATARITSAKAAVTKAEADRDKVAADIEAAKARVEVAKAEAARVKALRGYLEIKAPYDGVITRRAVNPGDLVSASEKVALFSVARIDPVRVVVQVPEADAALVAVGQSVRLSLQTGQTTEQTGKVIRTSWSLEPGSRTLRTEIDMSNPKELIRPGTYVYAKLTAELPAAWAVPATAVAKVGDESMIYLVENGKAVRVAVQPFRGDGKFTQLKEYKKPGAADWTVLNGSESVATPASAVTDGQTIDGGPAPK
jgi:multidrug efflux pump subunit AcrA (membrane-fusion protein)